MEEASKEQEEKIPDWEEAFKEEQEAKNKTVDKREIEFLLPKTKQLTNAKLNSF